MILYNNNSDCDSGFNFYYIKSMILYNNNSDCDSGFNFYWTPY